MEAALIADPFERARRRHDAAPVFSRELSQNR